MKKIGASYMVHTNELSERPQAPSTILREHEARLLMELIRTTHLDGHRFDGWPTITARVDDTRFGGGFLHLTADVKAVPA